MSAIEFFQQLEYFKLYRWGEFWEPIAALISSMAKLHPNGSVNIDPDDLLPTGRPSHWPEPYKSELDKLEEQRENVRKLATQIDTFIAQRDHAKKVEAGKKKDKSDKKSDKKKKGK